MLQNTVHFIKFLQNFDQALKKFKLRCVVKINNTELSLANFKAASPKNPVSCQNEATQSFGTFIFKNEIFAQIYERSQRPEKKSL